MGQVLAEFLADCTPFHTGEVAAIDAATFTRLHAKNLVRRHTQTAEEALGLRKDKDVLERLAVTKDSKKKRG